MFLALGQNAFALDAALGAGLELNMNAPENFAGAVVLGFDVGLPGDAPFAAGINATGSSNFSGVNTLELSALFRWYFARGGAAREGWFAQANIGGSLVRMEGDAPLALVAEARAGFRRPLGERFFIEPYARVGFPVLLGAGVVGGIRFPSGDGRRAARAQRGAALEITGAIVCETDEGVRISLQNINFPPGSAQLREAEMGKIHEIAEILRAIPNARIRVDGHAAPLGAEEDMRRLSVERAENIAALLIALGAVRAENVSAAGHGSARPIADNDTPEGMAANRRIEITILEED